jgi:hypothetical protein
MTTETQQLAARYSAAWAEHDLDAIMGMHTAGLTVNQRANRTLGRERPGL